MEREIEKTKKLLAKNKKKGLTEKIDKYERMLIKEQKKLSDLKK